VASYHCQVKIISRGAGRSATAAAAYRAGERIACEREGRTHDYTKKEGVEASFIHAPAGTPDWVQDRATLWNKAEEAEVRSNARVAREWEIALPHELSADQRQELANDYARALVDRYGAAVDVSIHAPHRHGDKRNYHAHIMVTTRKVGPEGFGGKTRVLDDRKTGPKEIEVTREMWADMQNDRLQKANISERVDHRSLEAQRTEAQDRGDAVSAAKLDRPAEKHMGPEVSAIERREQYRAKRDGRDYRPVTERGREVAEAREYRSLFDRVRELRTNYSKAREEGQGRLAALRSSMADLREGSAEPTKTPSNFLGQTKETPMTDKADKKSNEQRRDDSPFASRGPSVQAQKNAADKQAKEQNKKFSDRNQSEGNRWAGEQKRDVEQKVEQNQKAAERRNKDNAKGNSQVLQEKHAAQDRGLAKGAGNQRAESRDALQKMREGRENSPQREPKNQDRDR
jgi:hypothetical protein